MTLHPRRQPLTPYELQGRLRRLDFSLQEFAGLHALDSHTVRRWAKGESPIPRWVGPLLDYIDEVRDKQKTIEWLRESVEALQAARGNEKGDHR